ncbi:MAG: epoxide hydrolase [Chloroflexia bacterium]|nr:epoxide hydrolase [Chloroflexia bacterium]
MTNVEPFEVDIPRATLDNLRGRLGRTRWPNELPGLGWTFGPPRDYLRDLVDYWRDGFDWRVQEARLNALPNFRTVLDGMGIHFIHRRGRGPAPLPLLLAHGYPSSPYEYLDLIQHLTDPGAHGGDPADAFDVVVPSIPGHGFSDCPANAGFEDRAIADLFRKLMADLGHERFGIHAYDIGASIAGYLCLDHPDNVIGYHTTDPANPSPHLGPESPAMSDAERAYMDLRKTRGAREGAYAHILGTKHQTLAYSLNDSPAGLAAWIIEKWYAWTVPPIGNIEDHFTRDDLLANVTIYWATETINAANRYYAEVLEPLGPNDKITVPTGVALPANDPAKRPPRDYVARLHTDIRYWRELPRGGHFVAKEEPELLAESIRTFFRPLR